mmetsp:Transcript_14428/g.21780  ORF Transcript_14428/g.21780 Transcript_14428/m.21780 type:complete len:734 (-) Transcript_14428:322-2523(-)
MRIVLTLSFGATRPSVFLKSTRARSYVIQGTRTQEECNTRRLLALAAAATATAGWSYNQEDVDDDAWLEEIEGEKALKWVREQNARTVTAWGNPITSPTYQKVLEALESKDKIPGVSKIGNFYYNFWTEKERPRGILRRCKPEEYAEKEVPWETVLDIDALCREDDCSYVYKGIKSFKPTIKSNPRRTLVALSPGGSDAVIRREFDLEKKKFVPIEDQAFVISTPEKHSCSWLDNDTLLIAIGLSDKEKTDSGYPRVLREWKRGTDLKDAPIVYTGKKSDVTVGGSLTRSRGVELEWRYRAPSFYTSRRSVRRHTPKRDGVWYDLQELGIPQDASVFAHGAVLLIELRTSWLSFSAGALLAVGLDDLCQNGISANIQPLFLPQPHTSLKGISASKNLLALVIQDHVKPSLHLFNVDLVNDILQIKNLNSILTHDLERPQIRALSVSAVDSDESDDFFLRSSSFLEPSTLSLLQIDQSRTTSKLLKTLPHMFQVKANQIVEQRFATSADGTQVPYFLIKNGDNTQAPCLIFAYGGFEISLGPSYNSALGRGWLERGGHYVLANLRGGGEYGPSWHKAALKENRQKAYDDLNAVAKHLVESGLVDSAKRIAVRGGSNGGLLTANAYVQQPENYGAIVSAVPLTNMKKYSKLLAGASWMDEYGDPNSDDWNNFLHKYSPYHNINPKDIPIYPPLLVTTSTKDDRVHPYHARAFTHKLLDLGATNVWYYENIEGKFS